MYVVRRFISELGKPSLGIILSGILDEPVERYAVKECVVLDSGLSVVEAARVMRERGVESVVVAKEGRLVGMLTLRDILYKVVAEGRDPRETRIGEVASKPLITVEAGTKVGEAMALMVRRDIRRLPVMKAGKLVGVLIMRLVIGDLVKKSTPLVDVEPPEGVRCPYCGSTFRTRAELSKHIDRVHIGAGILEGVAKW